MAIEINPWYDWAYSNRGGVYIVKGQYDKAISDCNKAIEINPRYAMAYNELYLKVVFKGKGGVSTGRLLAAVNRPH